MVSDTIERFLEQTDYTKIESPELQSFVNQFKGEVTLESVIDMMVKISHLEEDTNVPLNGIRIRGSEEIFKSKRYSNFVYDNVALLLTSLRAKKIPASYALFVHNGTLNGKIKDSITKPMVVAYLNKQKYLIDVENQVVTLFRENYFEFIFCEEGVDPLRIGLRTTNDLVSKIEELVKKRRIALGDDHFMGVYGKRGEIEVSGGAIELPESVLNTISRRNERHFKEVHVYYLAEIIDGTQFVSLLDHKTFGERRLEGRVFDHKDINKGRIDSDGKISVPSQYHGTLELNNGNGRIILAATEHGQSMRLFGWGEYLSYFEKFEEQQSLFKRYQFDFQNWGTHQLDTQAIIRWKDILRYFLIRRDIIDEKEFKEMNQTQLKERLNSVPEKIMLYFQELRRADRSKEPPVMRVYDFKPTEEMSQDGLTLHNQVISHFNKTTIGKQILRSALDVDMYRQLEKSGININLIGRGPWYFDITFGHPYLTRGYRL